MTCVKCDSDNNRYIIGCDPTLTCTGLSLFCIDTYSIVDSHSIKTPKPKEFSDDIGTTIRIDSIVNAFNSFTEKHKTKNITLVGIESPAYRASGRLAQLGGIYYSLLTNIVKTYDHNSVITMPPTTIKILITDNGHAEKDQVEAGLNKLGIKTAITNNYDETDAAAAAVGALTIMDYASNNKTVGLSSKQIKAIQKILK